MNYYEHHLGDWAAATGHLTWDEDMAYTRLLRAYYHAERAIPDGQQYRLAKATTPAQRKAVDTVLAEFFTLIDGDHHQKRADAEIERFQDKQRKAKASANARWSHTGRNANASQNAMRTHSEGNALQTPDTSNQTPMETRESAQARPAAGAAPTPKPPRPAPLACPDGVAAQVWADWLALRKAKRAPVTATVIDGARSEAAKAGMPLEAFLRVWCARGSQGLQAEWLKPDERPGYRPNGQPAMSTAERNAESRRLLGFAPEPATQPEPPQPELLQ